METINKKDRQILRNLAKHRQELHNSEKNLRNIKDWLSHNTFCGARPMVHLEISFRHELIPQRLKCEGQLARHLEEKLWEGVINHEVIGDDYPITDYFHIEWGAQHTPFGIDTEIIHATGTSLALGYKIDYPIRDLKADFFKFGQSKYTINKPATMAYAAVAADVFGDILPVKIASSAFKVCPTRFFVHVMGMEALLFSMYDYPELFHEIMGRFADDTLSYFRFLEENGAVNPTVSGEYLGQGSWCYTDELPASGPVTSKDMWGFLDSQESVGISPEMFKEMIFPYYKKIADQFGLLSFGCCEPVHPFWDTLSTLDNLRKITISPWCDEEFMGEVLRGRKTVYHRKPSSNFLGVGINLDEDGLRKHIAKTIQAARGCTLEITQRDVYTIHHNEAKARRFIEIIREEIENHW